MSQVNIYLLATSTLDISQSKVGPLLAVLAAGVASGSILAGIWSGGEVNPGLTPIGAAVIVVATLMMFALIWVARGGSDLAYYWSVGFLFLMGVGGGLYDVPLRSYMQEYSPRQTRGEILAAANFLIFAGMLLASGVFWGLTAVAGLSAPELFLIGSIISAAVGAIAFWFVGDRTLETLRQLASTIGRLLGGEAS
jgi:acyl-[acyl-carrier-protein]-phospholipid O-acyltransferase/long-chain-fatty-acid--[acyl-carrier-protein] ligase